MFTYTPRQKKKIWEAGENWENHAQEQNNKMKNIKFDEKVFTCYFWFVQNQYDFSSYLLIDWLFGYMVIRLIKWLVNWFNDWLTIQWWLVDCLYGHIKWFINLMVD